MIALDPYIVEALSWALILGGCFFYVTGAIGLIRMPDVFARMHATSVSETLGVGMLIAGMMFQAGFTLNSARLAIIFMLLMFTGPIVTHAMARSAQFAGVKPLLVADRTGASAALAPAPARKARPAARARKGGRSSKR